MADKRTLQDLIDQHGGVLVRHRKHPIYRFPGGVIFVVPATPRCPHAYANAVATLRKLLQLNGERGAEGGNGSASGIVPSRIGKEPSSDRSNHLARSWSRRLWGCNHGRSLRHGYP